MGEKTYELGSGQIFIGKERLASIDLAEFTTEIEDMINQPCIIDFDKSHEASFTGYLIAGRGNGKSGLAIAHLLMGIDKTLRDLCPNKRVIHLAYKHKRWRTRNKNYKRMIKLAGRSEVRRGT